MKAEQVDQALRQKFITEEERLVFWHDEAGEFTDYVTEELEGDLATVKVVEPARLGGLSTKLLLEREDPNGQYLVYSTGERPVAKEDWLFDIRLYSAEFHADIASIWLQELGLKQLYLHDHLKARAAFLNSKERRHRLAKLVSKKDDESALDRKMLAVLVNATVATPFAILRAVCDSHANAHQFNLEKEPEILKTVEKMELLDSFWDAMTELFDYQAETPTVAGLLRCLFFSELSSLLGKQTPHAVTHYCLSSTGARNAGIFLTRWRDSNATAASHDAAAEAIWKEGKVDGLLGNLDLPKLENVFTFWGIEKQIVSRLKQQLLDDALPVDADAISTLASKRKAGHWLAGPGKDEINRVSMAEAYDALVAAADLFALHSEHRNRLSFEDPEQLLSAYQAELYLFDQAYRRFHLTPSPLSRKVGIF